MTKKQYIFPEVRIIEIDEVVIATSGEERIDNGGNVNGEDPNAPARMTLLPPK